MYLTDLTHYNSFLQGIFLPHILITYEVPSHTFYLQFLLPGTHTHTLTLIVGVTKWAFSVSSSTYERLPNYALRNPFFTVSLARQIIIIAAKAGAIVCQRLDLRLYTLLIRLVTHAYIYTYTYTRSLLSNAVEAMRSSVGRLLLRPSACGFCGCYRTRELTPTTQPATPPL